MARQRGVALADARVTADVTLGVDGTDRNRLRVWLSVTSSAIEHAVLRDLAEAAHAVCPFSRAIEGNVEVATRVG